MRTWKFANGMARLYVVECTSQNGRRVTGLRRPGSAFAEGARRALWKQPRPLAFHDDLSASPHGCLRW